MSVLRELVEHRGHVVTRQELLDAVWGDRYVSPSALSTQIKEIRRAVGDTGRAQSVVKTVHGRGYTFVATVASDGTTAARGHLEPDDAPRPVIAVLPLEDLSADRSRAHVASGLTSDVIAGLTNHRWLRVLGRSISAGYAGRRDAVTALRDDAGARYVVEGAVAVDARRLHVTIELTDSTTGTCVWAQRFDRDVHDLFDVLDEITDVVVANIEPQLGYAERDRVRRRPHTDLQAWDLLHLGIAHLFEFTASGNLEARRLLEEARRIDPNLGEAHAWWAYAMVLGMTYWEIDPDAESLDAALQATDLALEADDRDAAFQMIRGRVRLARQEYADALVLCQRAVELNPTFAAAYCGLGDSMSYEARYDEAIGCFTRSIELGTYDPQRWAFLSYGALALTFAGRDREAVDWADQAMALPNCQYWAAAHRVVALARSSSPERCGPAVASLLDRCPHFSVEFARRKLFYLKRREQIEGYLGALDAAGVPRH